MSIQCWARNRAIELDECIPNVEHPACEKCPQEIQNLSKRSLKQTSDECELQYRKPSRKIKRACAPRKTIYKVLPKPKLRTSKKLYELCEKLQKVQAEQKDFKKKYNEAWAKMEANPKNKRYLSELKSLVDDNNAQIPTLLERQNELWSVIAKERFSLAMGADYYITLSQAKRHGWHQKNMAGDDGCNASLLKLIAWDRSFLFESWVTARILTEDERNNEEFLKALGSIISKPSGRVDGKCNDKLFYFIQTKWSKNTTLKDMHEMFSAEIDKGNFSEIYLDPDEFRKLCKQWGFKFAPAPRGRKTRK